MTASSNLSQSTLGIPTLNLIGYARVFAVASLYSADHI
jgi:hypothetical protein